MKHSTLVIKPEVLDDLWVLEKLVDKGDVVSGRTLRSMVMQRDGVNVKTGQRPVFLKIIAESMDYSEQELRVKGKIIEGPDDVSHGYHTFEIKPDNVVTIEKPNGWKKWQLQRLENASIAPVKILACVLDESEADFASITNKVDMLFTIRGPSGKAYDGYEESKKRYYIEIINFIKDKLATHEKIVIAGPGFTKENVIKIIKEKEDFANRITVDSVSHTGISGIQELMNRGTIDRLTKSSDISKQTQLIDLFFKEVATDGLITYGLLMCKAALESGNAKILMISDEKVRQNDELLALADSTKTEIKIIDTHHEAGKRFNLFGGIAVFLRYKIR